MSDILSYNISLVDSRQKTLDLRKFSLGVVIGVGGIGSWVALTAALTRMFPTLMLFDPDIVETTNLNRTPFRIKDIGEYKVNAMEQLILERVDTVNTLTYPSVFTQSSYDCIKGVLGWDRNDSVEIASTKYHKSTPVFNCVIFDCRDNIYDDIKLNSLDRETIKVWKIGYNGMGVTIDGNPTVRKVMGESSGYDIVPSLVCPSQLAANLVVQHMITYRDIDTSIPEDIIDIFGDYNSCFTFDSRNLLFNLHETFTGE